MSKTIKVVSFNIEYCASITNGYWQYLTSSWKYFFPHDINAMQKISGLINQENIDIAAFMEMDGPSRRTRKNDYIKILSEATSLKNVMFYPTHKLWFNMANQGNGIITRYTILETRNELLESSLEDRYLSMTRLRLDDGYIIYVLTTQLALGRKSREKELTHIARIINTLKEPVIFAGDLNVHYAHELDLFRFTKLKRVVTRKTFPSWNPRWRLDYMFYSPEFELLDSHVLEHFKASDHLPIVAEFRLRDVSTNKRRKK